jgi:hypothetical protein
MAKAEKKSTRKPVVHIIGGEEKIYLQPGEYLLKLLQSDYGRGVREGIEFAHARRAKGGRHPKLDRGLELQLRTRLENWYRAERAAGRRPTYKRAVDEIRMYADLPVADSTLEEHIIAPVWKSFRK